jgi:hypothetical protein
VDYHVRRRKLHISWRVQVMSFRGWIRSCYALLGLVVALGMCRQTAAQSVYWDVSHGVTDNYRPTGRYSVLVNHLTPQGFSFVEGNVPLSSAAIGGADVLVVAVGSSAFTPYTAPELAAIDSFVRTGGGLLILSDVAGASGIPQIQQVANLYNAQVGLTQFTDQDVFSTSIGGHPSVAGVNQIYLRFSSTISPGDLSVYALFNTMPMLAAGNVDQGRVVLIADGDLFSQAPDINPAYFDRAQNRQLAVSTFEWLALPEPGTAGAGILLLGLRGTRCRHRPPDAT